VQFEETEKISTYLFEIAVGDWEEIVLPSNSIPMSLYCRKDLVWHAQMF